MIHLSLVTGHWAFVIEKPVRASMINAKCPVPNDKWPRSGPRVGPAFAINIGVQEVLMSFNALPLGSLVALGAVMALWMSSELFAF
jgi:hypothetical protein